MNSGAHSGASGRSFRRHPATQTGVSGHFGGAVSRPEFSLSFCAVFVTHFGVLLSEGLALEFEAVGIVDETIKDGVRKGRFRTSRLSAPCRHSYRQSSTCKMSEVSAYLQRGEAGLQDQSPKPNHVWNRVPTYAKRKVVDLALQETELSPRELAAQFTDQER